jgi:hypothetical protein
MITPSFGLTATERVLPRLALDFTIASLDPRVTFTRSGDTATVTNSSGYVVPINADLPRFDYNPTTLVCKGLLIEESRINLFLYSEDFSQATWAKNNATISSDSTNSPANTLTADTLIEDTATSAHYTEQFVTFATGAISYSVYLKASTRTKVRLQISDLAISVVYVDADLSAGTVSSPVPGASWTNASASIQPAANGFYRVTLTATASAGALKAPAIFLLDNSGNVSYTGDGTSGLFIWGAQVEAGAFATSYIPTTTTSLTRNADVATMTGTNFSDWFNASEGSLAIETTASANSATVYVCISDGTQTTNSFYFDNDSGSIRNITFSGSAPVSVLNLSSIGTVGATVKLVGAYKLNSYAASKNAATPVTGGSGAVPVAPNELRIGSSPFDLPPTYVSGHVKKVFYWPQRLINAEVQAFSK